MEVDSTCCIGQKVFRTVDDFFACLVHLFHCVGQLRQTCKCADKSYSSHKAWEKLSDALNFMVSYNIYENLIRADQSRPPLIRSLTGPQANRRRRPNNSESPRIVLKRPYTWSLFMNRVAEYSNGFSRWTSKSRSPPTKTGSHRNQPCQERLPSAAPRAS